MEQFKHIESQYFQKLNKELALQLDRAKQEIDKCNKIIEMCKQVLATPSSKSIDNLIEEINRIEGEKDDKDFSEKNT